MTPDVMRTEPDDHTVNMASIAHLQDDQLMLHTYESHMNEDKSSENFSKFSNKVFDDK